MNRDFYKFGLFNYKSNNPSDFLISDQTISNSYFYVIISGLEPNMVHR